MFRLTYICTLVQSRHIETEVSEASAPQNIAFDLYLRLPDSHSLLLFLAAKVVLATSPLTRVLLRKIPKHWSSPPGLANHLQRTFHLMMQPVLPSQSSS